MVFGSFGVFAECVGKKGKDFHDCLKQQLIQPSSKELTQSNERINEKCRYEPKYFPKINKYIERLVGDVDCVMADVMADDQMIAGYWIEEKSKTLFIAINNIRAGRDIDIDFYGFDERYKTSMLEKIDNISSIKFLKRFSYNGATQPQIEMRLNEAGFKR